MGIWNPQTLRLSLLPNELITPHGDLEQSLPSICAHSDSPHNPSWGFGTVQIVRDNECDAFS